MFGDLACSVAGFGPGGFLDFLPCYGHRRERGQRKGGAERVRDGLGHDGFDRKCRERTA